MESRKLPWEILHIISDHIELEYTEWVENCTPGLYSEEMIQLYFPWHFSSETL